MTEMTNEKHIIFSEGEWYISSEYIHATNSKNYCLIHSPCRNRSAVPNLSCGCLGECKECSQKAPTTILGLLNLMRW